jgi:hypothetical protein
MRLALAMICCAAWLLVPLRSSALAADEEFFAASVRHLRSAVHKQRHGRHLPRLFALRQLGDPTLRPLFAQLARHDEWQVQVHAILGLAEISDPRRIDPWLVAKIDPAAQEALIANAIDMDLLGSAERVELLELDQLQAVPRLLLLGEQVVGDQPVDRDTLRRLAGAEDDHIAGLASILLAKCGELPAFERYTNRLDERAERVRDQLHIWIFEAIRQYDAKRLSDWVQRVLERPDLDDDVRYWGIFTALTLDPTTGLDHWRAALGSSPSYPRRVRFAMLLLAADGSIPPSAYVPLSGEEELIQRMIDVGRAQSTGDDPSDELIALLELGHMKTSEWAMGRLEELPPQQSIPVYGHLIDTVEQRRVGRQERVARAIEAVGELYRLAPDQVVQRLSAAEDDSLTQEVIMLGLLDATSTAASDAVTGIRRIGAGRADTLALLLIARHAETMESDELRQLGLVAAGGGRVSEGLQVQASWLYLKHTDSINRALTLIFDRG